MKKIVFLSMLVILVISEMQAQTTPGVNSFDCQGNLPENDAYYITNIKIIKE